MLYRHFATDPPESAIGTSEAARVFFRHLDAISMAGDLVLRRSAFVYRSGLPSGGGWGGVLVFALLARRCRARGTAASPPAALAQRGDRRGPGGAGVLDQPHLRQGLVLPHALGLGDDAARRRVDRLDGRARSRGSAGRAAGRAGGRAGGRERCVAGRDHRPRRHGRVGRCHVRARGARAAAVRRPAGGAAGDGRRDRARRWRAGRT